MPDPAEVGFPRVRGDVPGCSSGRRCRPWFSPRARGCSPRAVVGVVSAGVFPACAGMFLSVVHKFVPGVCFPRVRGDVPGFLTRALFITPFSPRARGCSQRTMIERKLIEVFPACAGMFRSGDPARGHHASFPRVRGDVPRRCAPGEPPNVFSPRARGCSASLKPPAWSGWVFPACAGMFRMKVPQGAGRLGFPRVRGDVPA